MEYDVLVVIQGPMISSGWNSGSGNQISNFNCLAYIQKYLNSNWKRRYKFVVSTWETKDFFEYPEGLDVIHNIDPGALRCINSINKTNDFRQALSAFNGLNRYKCDLSNFKYCIKVRTDQFVDIDGLVDHMESYIFSMGIHGVDAPIFFPNVLEWSPYSVGDFFIGSTPLQLYKFFDSQLRHYDIQCSDYLPWTHSEIIFRYVIGCYKDIIPLGVPRIGFDVRVHPQTFAQSRIPYAVLDSAKKLHKDLIVPFCKVSTATLEWRGESYDLKKHSNGLFYEEWVAYKNCFNDYVADLYPGRFLKGEMSFFQRFIFFQKDAMWLRNSKLALPMVYLIKFIRDIVGLCLGYLPMSNALEKIRDKINAT